MQQLYPGISLRIIEDSRYYTSALNEVSSYVNEIQVQSFSDVDFNFSCFGFNLQLIR